MGEDLSNTEKSILSERITGMTRSQLEFQVESVEKANDLMKLGLEKVSSNLHGALSYIKAIRKLVVDGSYGPQQIIGMCNNALSGKKMEEKNDKQT